MNSKSMIKDILAYIENHLEEDLALDKIAKELNYSKFYLERAFTENIGCSIYKYIQLRRLTEAARKLVETDKSIIEIAYEAQYNSQQAFTFAFKKVYLCTPQVYRQRGVFTPKQWKAIMQSKICNSGMPIAWLGGRMAA